MNTSIPSPILLVSSPHKGIALITINRPERRNALNNELKLLLTKALQDAEANSEISVIVLTGAGGYFVAGADLSELRNMQSSDHNYSVAEQLFATLKSCRKPVIAAVEGFALGGGCELAMACDMIIAGSDAKFGQPEIKVGIMPGAGGTQRLVRAIGKYQAMRYLLTGEAFTAKNAFDMGMISEVTPSGFALERALAEAHVIACMPPLAVRAIKEVVLQGSETCLDTALALERKAFQALFETEDQKEGMDAFLEKRIAHFKGC
jgi:enoyl-CoA hydratase/carnithine racemase